MELLTLGQRLKFAIKSAGGNKKVADQANVPLGTLNNYIREVSEPTFEKITKISAACEVSLDWLAFGEGEQKKKNKSIDESSFTTLPLLDISASAGMGLENTPTELARNFISFDNNWLRQNRINPSSSSIITVEGDSMEPTIRNGDMLIVDHSINTAKDNGIYIIVVNNSTFVKRVQFNINGSIILISDNPVYPNEDIDAEDITYLHISGRVMWFGRGI